MAREEFRTKYNITSVKGKVYDRAALRACIRKGLRGCPSDHITIALGLLDDDGWLSFRRNQTPSSVLRDIERVLYGDNAKLVRNLRRAPRKPRQTEDAAESPRIGELEVGSAEPFCACGRRVSQCDGSRRGCKKPR